MNLSIKNILYLAIINW